MLESAGTGSKTLKRTDKTVKFAEPGVAGSKGRYEYHGTCRMQEQRPKQEHGRTAFKRIFHELRI